jgi:hypothetical protein
MSSWIGRTRVPGVLLVVAIGLAACGGSSNQSSAVSGSATSASGGSSATSTSGGGGAPLTVREYESKGSAALAIMVAALKPIDTTSGVVDPGTWSKIQSTAQQAGSTFSGLMPPSDVAALNARLASSLSGTAAAAGKIASDLRDNNRSAARADEAAYKAAFGVYGQAVIQLLGKGVRFAVPQ